MLQQKALHRGKDRLFPSSHFLTIYVSVIYT